MKLRQKLAVVLASAMVVTAVPVVTMAASTNSVSKTVTVSTDDLTLGELGSVPVLKIDLKDAMTTNAQFYLTLENAKWNNKNAQVADVKVGNTVVGTVTTSGSETEATVTLTTNVAAKDLMIISLDNVKVTGEAKVIVDGNETEVTNSTITFANKSNSKAGVTVKDDTTFYTTTTAGEEVGTIVITEAVAGSFASASEADRTITIELEHGDFEFLSTSAIKVKGGKGFSSYTATAANWSIDTDKETITIVLPQMLNKAKGTFEISGIKVKSTDKAPEAADLEVTVAGKGDTKVESTTVKVATVAEYGTKLEVKEKKDVVSGKKTKVKLTYKEVTPDSVAKSDVDFVLNKGYITKSTLPTGAEPIYKDSKKPKDSEIIGFTIACTGTDSKIDKFLDEKEIEIVTKLDTEGEITFTTSGRYVDEQSVVVAEVAPNFTIKAEAMTLKVGQSKQVGGKFVITETEKGALDKSSVITLELPDEDGISFTELPTVTVDGAKAKVDWKDATSKSAINITLTKASKETPATITVEGVEVKVDRTVPQGTYDLKLSINGYEGTLKSKDFFVVGTPNTEELAANGLPKGTATFTINSAEYTVNGKVATMDATAYIQDPGYTMVPVRYVATAFGVNAQDILFSNGTATIFAGSRTIQLTAGSDIAVVNGASIKLATKVVVKDGRTYAPVGEIARILGVSVNWDSASKVATFENK